MPVVFSSPKSCTATEAPPRLARVRGAAVAPHNEWHGWFSTTKRMVPPSFCSKTLNETGGGWGREEKTYPLAAQVVAGSFVGIGTADCSCASMAVITAPAIASPQHATPTPRKSCSRGTQITIMEERTRQSDGCRDRLRRAVGGLAAARDRSSP